MTAQQHRATEELLPFWANGSLDDDERLEVERALKADENLSEQVAMLRLIRGAIQDSDDIQSPGEFGLARLHRALDRETAQPSVTRRTAAISALAAAVVGGLVVFGLEQGGQGNVYRQASTVIDQPMLTVAFSPDASEASIRDLLQRYSLSIVNGPSALGLYFLSFPEGTDTDELSRNLRAETTIIQSADKSG